MTTHIVLKHTSLNRHARGSKRGTGALTLASLYSLLVCLSCVCVDFMLFCVKSSVALEWVTDPQP